MSDEWQGVTKDEYECDRLLSTQDEADWRAARCDDDTPSPTSADMIARWAGERAAIMAEYDPSDWGLVGGPIMTDLDDIGCPDTPDRLHVWLTDDCVVWPNRDGRITVCEACGLIDNVETIRWQR